MTKAKAKRTKDTKLKGYVYHLNQGKVSWTDAEWGEFLKGFKDIRIEAVELDDEKDWLISARGTKGVDWGQRNLIAETYKDKPHGV